MAVAARGFKKQVIIGDSGDLRAMHLHKPCRYIACLEHGVTALGDEDLCCDHFVLRSYEFLEQIDSERRKNNNDSRFTTNLKESMNEYLRGALEVSLKCEALSNLQKARLLDIMLWAGEFIHRTDAGRIGGNGLCGGGANPSPNGKRAAYAKPEMKARTSGSHH
ncbi:MAG TPA: hypothetical protein VKP58_10730 [Candidatus Acidoferrum sp.]|nr:hypothetical protein [Candidatus Acidoferrum sp.]